MPPRAVGQDVVLTDAERGGLVKMAGCGSTLPPMRPSQGRLTTFSRWIAPGLRRCSATHCRSVRESALRQVVVLHGPMLHGAIIPEQQIARLLLVAIDEGRLDNAIG